MSATETNSLEFDPAVAGNELYQAIKKTVEETEGYLEANKEGDTAYFHVRIGPQSWWDKTPLRGRLYLESVEITSFSLNKNQNYQSLKYEVHAYGTFFPSLNKTDIKRTNQFIEQIYTELGQEVPEEALL